MKKFYFTLFFVLVLCGLSNAQTFNTIESELQTILNQKSEDLIDIHIYFKSNVDSKQLNQKTRKLSTKTEKRNVVVDELKKHASVEQSDVVEILKAEELSGNVSNIKVLWITNSISCKASRDVIYQLSSYPNIKMIGIDKEIQIMSPEQMKDIPNVKPSATRGPAHHVVTVNADDVWNQGYTGKNVIVAVLDSGTNTEHVDLKDHLWEGYIDTNGDGTPDKLVNGWNFTSDNENITDDYGHGTHCAGIVCGDGTSGTTAGVAPDAMLMTLKTINRAGGGSVTGMLSGVQFAVENGADVLSLSLGYKHSQLTVTQKESIREAFDNVLRAGVVACAAVGNDGTSIGLPWNVDYPAACPAPWLNPAQTLTGGTSGVIAVGADDLVGKSSQGPSTWEDTKYVDYAYNSGASMGLIRPDISAPGNFITSSHYLVNDDQRLASGTSQATPCVAGVIALMLEKNMALTPQQISQIIEETAANKPAKKDNIVGAGRVDALAAVNSVTEGLKLPHIQLTSFTPETTTPGQTTNISLTFKNNGKGSSAELSTAEISTSSPYVSVTETLQTLGQISTGNSKNLNFEITIDPSTPNGHVASFDLVMTSGDLKWRGQFSIKISTTPSLVFNGVTPAFIDAGEDANITVSLKNNGTSALDNSTTLRLLTVSNDLKYVTIVDGDATMAALGAGETGSATFTINANTTIPHNYGLDLFLELNSESSTVADFVYEFEDDLCGWTFFDAAKNNISKPGTAIAKPWWHSSEAVQRGKLAVSSKSGNGHVMSASNEEPYYYTNPLDNYLVSPKKIKVTENSKLTFYVRPTYSYAERYGVAISTNGNNSATDFTTIQQWVASGTGWTERVIDLSNYAGQEIYVAIRHFFTQSEWDNSLNGADYDALCIDDITLSDVMMSTSHTPTYSSDDPYYFRVYVNNMVDLPKVENLQTTATSTSTINLTWDDINEAHNYNIYRNGQRIATVTENSYTDQNLTHNTLYCYEVAAVYSGVEFEHSDASCIKTLQKETSVVLKEYSPDIMYMGVNTSFITATIVNDGSEQLPAKGIFSLLCDDPFVTIPGTASFTTTSLMPLEEVTKTFTGITIDQNIPNNYVLTFYANLLSQGTQDSEKYEFNLPLKITVKNDSWAPKNLIIRDYSDMNVTLEWDPVDNAIGYNIYRDGAYIGTTSSTMYFDNELTPSTNYCYTVTSINSEGESDFSVEQCVTTNPEDLGILFKSFTLENTHSLGTNLELNAILINKSGAATPAGTATLTCSDPNVSIVDGEAKLSALADGGETTVTFTIKLLGTTPVNHELDFDVTARYESAGGTGSTVYSYSFDDDMCEWTSIDANNDNHTWFHSPTVNVGDHGMNDPVPHTGTGYLLNSSYCSKHGGALTPDDYIISPVIKATEDVTVSFWVRSMGSDAYCQEHYGLAVSRTSNTTADAFTTIHQDTISIGREWGDHPITVSLNDYLNGYTGNIYIAIRHFDCTDLQAICLDDVTITCVSTGKSYTSTFSATVNPSLNVFTGTGVWSDASKWSKNVVPISTDDIIVNGNLTIESGDITVNTLSINNNVSASLTLNSGVNLTVDEVLNSTKADAFIIYDGCQVFQPSENVAATFRMFIDNPASWSGDRKGGWQFISSPVEGVAVTDFATTTTDYDLFKYDGTQELQWVNIKNHGIGTDFESEFVSGRGYIVSYEAQTSADFKGILNNDKSFSFKDIKPFDTEDHYNNFYLLGNPFSFDMNWDELSTVTDVYNGYATISNIDGSYDYHTSGTIKVGDGFLVKTTGNSPVLTYGNSRTRNEKQESINVIASNIHGSDNVVIYLAGQEEEGFLKLDNLNKDITNIYIGNNGKRYGIFSFDKDVEEVKLSFEAKHTGSHIISIEPEGEFEYITLVDNFTGEEINMLNGRYEFVVYSTENSRERFSLKFGKKAEPEQDKNFVYQSGDELIIKAQGTVQIIDVMGRIILTKEINGNGKIDISNYDKAMYIIRCLDDQQMTQKIIIN